MSDNITALVEAIGKATSRGFEWQYVVASIAPILIFAVLYAWEPIKSGIANLQLLWLCRRLEKDGSRKCLFLFHKSIPSLFNLGGAMINLGDAGATLKFFRQLKGTPTIELFINTPGGMVLAAQQMASAMKAYEGKINVYVHQYAMSGGTLLALAANKIYMAKHAVLGPLDPQLTAGLFDQYPCVSLAKAIATPNPNRDDKTLILADVAAKAVNQMNDYVYTLVKDRLPDDKAKELAGIMTGGRWTHDYAITFEKAQELGLWVSNEIPGDISRMIDKLPGEGSSLKYRKSKKKEEVANGIRISL